MILRDAAGPPPVPWWALYVMVLAVTWAVHAITRRKWWAGLLAAIPAGLLLGSAAVLALPANRTGLMLALALAPAAGFVLGLRTRRARELAPARGRTPAFALPGAAMQGQPSARTVLRSRMMPARFAAGMPRDAEFVARMAYVGGWAGMAARPVDLFAGGGRLWVGPLAYDAPPAAIPFRDVLRVDVWPEPAGPPTLRVTWSPPSGDLTRELVLAAMPNVEPAFVHEQVDAVAAALRSLVGAEAREREAASASGSIGLSQPVLTPPPLPAERSCSSCGATLPPDARFCSRCGAAA